MTEAAPDPDVIPVRPGEEIDAAAVGAYVAGRLPDASGTPDIWQFPGGHANLTYLLHYPGGTNYVLRRPPTGDLPASAHDMGREYRVLSVLYRAFPPAPRAFLYCENTSVIGGVQSGSGGHAGSSLRSTESLVSENGKPRLPRFAFHGPHRTHCHAVHSLPRRSKPSSGRICFS